MIERAREIAPVSDPCPDSGWLPDDGRGGRGDALKAHADQAERLFAQAHRRLERVDQDTARLSGGLLSLVIHALELRRLRAEEKTLQRAFDHAKRERDRANRTLWEWEAQQRMMRMKRTSS